MKITRLTLLLLLLAGKLCYGQGSLEENFNDNVLNGFTSNATYTVTEENGEAKIAVSKGQTNTSDAWASASFTFPAALNIKKTPYIKVRIKATPGTAVRIDLKDATGKVTNKSEVKKTVGTTYQEFTYSFVGTFYQEYGPPVGNVDSTNITGFELIVNPGNPYSGTVYLDDIKVGAATGILPAGSLVIVNQTGFYPQEKKLAVVNSNVPEKFFIVNTWTNDTVKRGNLDEANFWVEAADSVRRADFSDVTTIGSYKVYIPGIGSSYPFEIKEKVHLEVLKGGLKSFYFQRASMDLEEKYAGIYKRNAGPPDKAVVVHPSAATETTPADTEFKSPGGWYDAGDYGKYVVNSGISTYQMIALWEHYPKFFDTLNLNIPESNNGVPDILDEALFNVRWMLTMQDPKDSAVFSKLTPKLHDDIVMPESANSDRYLFKKTTPATLDFAAVMAQASRVYRKYSQVFPGLADSLLVAAEKAYGWALKNDKVLWPGNPSGVNTGEYYNQRDTAFHDEFLWAGAELFITTKKTNYLIDEFETYGYNIPGYNDVSTLGLISLNHYKNEIKKIAGESFISNINSKLDNLAGSLYNDYTNSIVGMPYGVQTWNYTWGGNSIAGNQGFILLEAYRQDPTNNKGYFDAALANLDYLLGRNATNYSFITGFGDKRVMHLHNRISESDGINDPLPGWIAGGPHNGQHNDCPEYPSSVKAKMYLDQFCSFSTNENAINYNSAFISLAGGIEAIKANASSFPTGIFSLDNAGNSGISRGHFSIYPNPATESIRLNIETTGDYTIQISDLSGKVHFSKADSFNGLKNETLSVSELEKGIYFIQVTNGSSVATEKFVKQ